jgi:hypothetical protein
MRPSHFMTASHQNGVIPEPPASSKRAADFSIIPSRMTTYDNDRAKSCETLKK